MDLAAARQSLAAAGYEAAPTFTPGEAPEGTVLEQSPAPGTTLPAGTTVALVVSSGPGETTTTLPATTTVPDVVGQRLAKALLLLARAGLQGNAAASVPNDDPGRAGTVAKQTPPAGSEAARGATVDLTVYAKP
ncbi:MAG: hypothetical protein Kow00122_01290 [Thermoleophilia bacterium]